MLSPSCAESPAPTVYPETPRVYRAGDDPGWAHDPDTAGWTTERPRDSTNWWFRVTLRVEEDARLGADPVLRVYAPGALQVFWDGELVGNNGVVGLDGASEVPGRFGAWMPIDPGRVTAGTHVVTVRVSSHRLGRALGPVGVLLLDRRATELREGRRTAAFLFCAGMLLLASLVFASLYRATGARADTLYFAVLCLSVSVLLFLEYAKYLWDYPYHWHLPRLVAITTMTIAVGILLPLFVAAHLQFSRLRHISATLMAIFVGLAFAFVDPDVHSLHILRTALGAAFLLSAAGVLQRRPGARWILLAVTINLLAAFATGFRYADHWFFVGFLALVAALLVLMARTLRRQARQRGEALLLAERLRYELLRKTIQPHFLMNSLAVCISRVEEDPRRGIEVLRDLADELEAFFRIGERNHTTLAEELELCRKHVRTMAHLLDRPLELTVDGDPGEEEIPPGVLLTLIENAVTHGDRERGSSIQVVVSRSDEGLMLEVRNPAPPPRDDSTGAGLRYVRAQLERSGSWRLDGHYRDGWWCATLRRAG